MKKPAKKKSLKPKKRTARKPAKKVPKRKSQIDKLKEFLNNVELYFEKEYKALDIKMELFLRLKTLMVENEEYVKGHIEEFKQTLESIGKTENDSL